MALMLQSKKSTGFSVAKLIVAIVVCEAIGGIGSIFTIGAVSTWYASLQKPWFTPPNWLFGPVWVTLFLLMGISLYLLWTHADKNSIRKKALILFGVQLALNELWTLLFFGLRQYFLGLIDIIVLWVAIGLTIVESYRVRKLAGLVLVPYIAWVTIATLLNYYVWLLNP